MTIFELNGLINTFLEENIDPETGEILNLEALEDLQLERSVKLENYALAVKNLDAEIAALKAESDKLDERRKRTERTRDHLKNVLLEGLRGEKMSTARVQVSYIKSQITEITDISLLSKKYLIPQPPKPDKNAIKAAINAGKTVKGAEIRKNVSIIIK